MIPSVARVFLSDRLEQRRGVGRLHEAGTEALVLEESRDARERLQMRARGILRCHQEEEEVRRLAVERVEIDALPAARERREDPLDPRQLAVRDRHALAERGAVQALAVLERLDEPLAVELGMPA